MIFFTSFRVPEAHLRNNSLEPTDEEVYEKLSSLKFGGGSPGKKPRANGIISGALNNLDEISEPRNTAEEFYSSIQESLTKLVQHNVDFVKDLLSKGIMNVLFPVVGGLALVSDEEKRA